MKKIYFISKEISQFLYADCNSHNLNIVNMGVTLFHRNSSKYSSNSECIFRISQDGLLNLIPYMSKRLIWAPTLADFKYFLMNRNVETNDIQNQELKANISNLTTGCFVLAVRVPKHVGVAATSDHDLVEGLVMHKFPTSVNMMVSRENIFGLHLRYLAK